MEKLPLWNDIIRNTLTSAVLASLLLTPERPVHAQAPVAAPADVRTIADIVRVSYEVINGPAGTPRQWRRDSTLYMPGATFVSVREREGRVESVIMTPEDYRRSNNDRFVAEGLFETEVGRLIERFGHVAQVRSVTVARRTRDGPIQARYVNYFQLYWDGTRWWIAGMVWDEERPSAPIPKRWVGRWEAVSR
jgi:hypothetical protein